MYRTTSSLRLAALALVCVLGVGCSGKGKPSQSNYDRLKGSETVKEVEEIMGKPKETFDFHPPGGPKMIAQYWEEGDTGYMVYFKDGKIEGKVNGKKSEIRPPVPENKRADPTKLTKVNVGKIKKGMTKSDVEAILGIGNDLSEQGRKTFVWEVDGKSITIEFADDKVKDFVILGF